jgi:ribosomal protein L35AE/L33A
MKDVLGAELEAGNNVIFTDYNRGSLYRGKVIEIRGNWAVIEYEAPYSKLPCTTRKSKDYVAKVES